MVSGPRAAGKTSTALQVAAEVVRLDEPGRAAVFRADPDAALRRVDEPVLLDEWQEAPEVLGAVKRAVDANSRPGRFVLTGSVRAAQVARLWPGTGRLVGLAMFGVTEAELAGQVDEDRVTLLGRLAAEGDMADVALPGMVPDLRDYVDLALRGGFPELVYRAHTEEGRRVWLEGYLDQLLSRDVAGVDPGRDPVRLRRWFEALALSSAGTPRDKTLLDAAGLNIRTAAAYDRLLEDLFVTERVPAWHSNRLSRLVATPKRYVVDPGLAAAATGVTARTVLADGDLLGRIFDSFATAQLRAELALGVPRPQRYHLRTEAGRQEVDLLIELPGGAVLGVEFKATSAPGRDDARHLGWLRDRLGERFMGGVVLHSGPGLFGLGDRVWAVPLCALWAEVPRGAPR